MYEEPELTVGVSASTLSRETSVKTKDLVAVTFAAVAVETLEASEVDVASANEEMLST